MQLPDSGSIERGNQVLGKKTDDDDGHPPGLSGYTPIELGIAGSEPVAAGVPGLLRDDPEGMSKQQIEDKHIPRAALLSAAWARRAVR